MDTRSLRHRSVILCAVACAAATGMLTLHAFFPHIGPPSACLWPAAGPSDKWLAESPAEPLAVPDLHLVDAGGQPVTTATLRGRVWLCDFFLTRCTGICPAL